MPYYGPGTPWHDRREKARGPGDIEANTNPATPANVPTDDSNGLSRDGYVRSGRGGAGNCAERQDSTSQSGVSADGIAIPRTTVAPPDGPSYSRTGRGGAGNYGTAFDSTVAVDELVQSTRENVTSPLTTHGRGGLGNYAAKALQDEEQSKKSEAGEQQKREALQLEIQKDVGETLAMPQKAKLPLSSPKDARVPT